MQKLRCVLETMEAIPPAPQPADFEREGEILREALSKLICGLLDRLDDMRAKGEALRKYAGAPHGDVAGFHHALQDFNTMVRKSFEVPDPRKQLRGKSQS